MILTEKEKAIRKMLKAFRSEFEWQYLQTNRITENLFDWYARHIVQLCGDSEKPEWEKN